MDLELIAHQIFEPASAVDDQHQVGCLAADLQPEANTKPALIVPGKMAMPVALPRMARGMALSSAPMISPNAFATVLTRWASSLSFCATGRGGCDANTRITSAATRTFLDMRR